MGTDLSSSPQVARGLINAPRDGSRLPRGARCGILSDFSARDVIDRSTRNIPARANGTSQDSSGAVRIGVGGAWPQARRRTARDDSGSKPLPAMMANRQKPAVVQISTFFTCAPTVFVPQGAARARKCFRLTDVSDTIPSSALSPPKSVRSAAGLSGWQGQQLDPPYHGPKQPPREMTLGQQQPVVSGALHQPAARLHPLQQSTKWLDKRGLHGKQRKRLFCHCVLDRCQRPFADSEHRPVRFAGCLDFAAPRRSTSGSGYLAESQQIERVVPSELWSRDSHWRAADTGFAVKWYTLCPGTYRASS